MKRNLLSLLLITTTTLILSTARAGTSLTAYGTYWDGQDAGKGGGLRLKKTVLGFGAVEGRGGYVSFDQTNTEVVPLDVSLNLRLPFMISPYAGIGAGFFLTSSDRADLDNTSAYFGQIGVEATFIWIGAMAEVRWYDTGESYLDGSVFNLGLLLKW